MFGGRIWVAATLTIFGLIQDAENLPTFPISAERFQNIERMTSKAENKVGGASRTTTSKENVNSRGIKSNYHMNDEPQVPKSDFSPTYEENKRSDVEAGQLPTSVTSRRVEIKPPRRTTTHKPSEKSWQSKMKAWFIDPWKRLFERLFSGLRPVAKGLNSRPLKNMRRAAFFATWPAYVVSRPLRCLRCCW